VREAVTGGVLYAWSIRRVECRLARPRARLEMAAIRAD
jgi:hypothetical protein